MRIIRRKKQAIQKGAKVVVVVVELKGKSVAPLSPIAVPIELVKTRDARTCNYGRTAGQTQVT